MPKSETQPWWSWAPTFPRKAIIGAMVAFDFIATETIAINLLTTTPTPSDFAHFIATIQTPSIIANFLALLVGFQLNFEVAHMILSSKRNQTDVQNAKAQGFNEGQAQGIAEGQVQGKDDAFAASQAWFQQYQADPDNAPPPPWANNSHNNGAVA